MIVLRRVVNLEHHCDLRIKVSDIESGKIGFRIEDQPVDAAGQRFSNEKKGFDAAVFVGPGVTEFGPALVGVLQVETNSYATGGRAARDVEYVRRDGAHTSLESTVWSLRVNNKNHHERRLKFDFSV